MGEEDSKEDLEIGDVEDYRHEKETFSHQQLVMKCLSKCVEAGSVEMTEGRIERKIDKRGNITNVYIPDTRRTFIESVKTAKNFMICDFDKEAETNINELISELRKTKKDLIEQERKWFNSLSFETKQKYLKESGGVMIGAFNLNFHFHNIYVSEEIEIYRETLEELNKLTKRLDFYAIEGYEA